MASSLRKKEWPGLLLFRLLRSFIKMWPPVHLDTLVSGRWVCFGYTSQGPEGFELASHISKLRKWLAGEVANGMWSSA